MITPSARRAGRGAARARRGFSLIELMVAMVLLTVGIMGLVAVSTYSLRQTNAAGRHSKAAMVAQSRMERLRSLDCSRIAGGSAVTDSVTESWSVTSVGNRTRTVTANFTYTRPPLGVMQTLSLQTTILCR
jgi:type IV pilus modification protein PilV